jgi:hypothetical protein
MGAGLHGINGVNPVVSLHIYKTYVLPRILYGLEAIHINPANLARLEVAHRSLLRNIQGLPKRTAIAALYIASGMLPMEALIERRRLVMIPQMAKNPLLYDLIHRQIAIKSRTSSSWVVKTQAILNKYGLPHIIDVIKDQTQKRAWKKMVDEAISKHWKKSIEEEAQTKSTTSYMNREYTAHQPHTVWRSTSWDPRDVRRATYKARILTGAYILQCNRAAFNQTRDTSCPLCKDPEEDIPHFLVQCSALSKERDPILKSALNLVPLVYQNHPLTWNNQQIAQLVLDPTHPLVAEKIPLDKQTIHCLERETRLLCFVLHRRRAMTLGYRP